MALVKLINNWFAPSEVLKIDKIRSFSGQMFERGVREIPDELIEFLPKYAVILDKKPDPVVEDKPVETLRDFDMERAAADDFEKAVITADKNRTAKKEK